MSKAYTLYPSPRAMVADLLGFNRLLGRADRFRRFPALKDLTLEVAKGERLGIIGRNGAGKSTLLKLVTGNFEPTSGTVEVRGNVHSLMDSGVGFHPEFTGRENIQASLIYNGLSRTEAAAALDEIVAFVELGEFLDQPIKTYSLGMVARLGFATATAVRPEILIIDEVLGAGDAYFTAKSAERIRKLSAGGATMLLVSHSLEQIVQFCDRAIWLEGGEIVQSGECLEVVKAYQAFIRNLDEKRILKENASRLERRASGTQREVSRWNGLGGLRIESVKMLDASDKETAVFRGGDPARIRVRYTAERDGEFPCRYHVYVYTLDGVRLLNHLSETEVVRMRAGESRTVELRYPKLLLGNGEFVFSVGLYKRIDLEKPWEPVEFYDLVDRSYQFRVQSDQPGDTSLVRHPCEWVVAGATTLSDTIAPTAVSGSS